MPSTEENKKAVTPAEDPQFSLRDSLPEEHPFSETEQLKAWTHQVQEAAHEDGTDLDVSALLKAQTDFIKAQMLFMTGGNPNNPEEGYRRIAMFSRAQGDYISALVSVLEQMGVV